MAIGFIEGEDDVDDRTCVTKMGEWREKDGVEGKERQTFSYSLCSHSSLTGDRPDRRMASNTPQTPIPDKGTSDTLNQPNSEGKEKKKIKEKAVLDEKTAAVLSKKGYEVEYKISQGSFGQVFTARNAKRGSIDAVKIMDLTKLSQRFKEKFLMREILTLIKVRHPNVLSV